MADGVEITRIEIKAKADTSTAKKNIDSLTDALAKLQKTASTSSGLKEALKLDAITKSLEKLSQLGKINISKTIGDRIEQIGKAVDGLKGVDFDKLDEMANALIKLSSVGNIKAPNINGGGSKSSSTSEYDRVVQKTQKIVDGLNASSEASAKYSQEVNHLKQAYDSGAISQDEYLKRLREINSEMVKSESTASAQARASEEATARSREAFAKVVSTVKSATLSIAKFGAKIATLPFRALASEVGRVTKRLGGVLSALKRIAFYRAIRTVIKEITQGFKEGTENLYQYSKAINGEFAKSMDTLATSSLYLKNSLGAMVGPIINALAPAVDYLVDRFVDLLNIVNETIASLTGAENWTRAIKYPVEYAEATSDATKAAKKFKATILGFDELNVLNDNSDNSKGGISDALDYSKMFTEESVKTSTSEWINKFKEAWENADFTEIGRSIGETLKNGLDSIPWNNIKKAGKKFSKSLGTLINGFVTTPGLGKSIGGSLAEVINTGVTTIHEFVTTVKWDEVGKFIGDNVNGFVKKIDAKKLAETLSDVIKGALKLISSFLHQTDFDEVGKKVGEFFNNIDWGGVLKDVGKAIWEGFKAALEGIGGLMQENPIAGAILVSILGLKIKNGFNALSTTVSSALFGSAASTATASGAGSAAGAAASGAAAGGLIGSLKTALMADATFSFGTVTAAVGTFIVGKGVGNWLYNNTPVGDWADNYVGGFFDSVEKTKKDFKELGDAIAEDTVELTKKYVETKKNIEDKGMDFVLTLTKAAANVKKWFSGSKITGTTTGKGRSSALGENLDAIGKFKFESVNNDLIKMEDYVGGINNKLKTFPPSVTSYINVKENGIEKIEDVKTNLAGIKNTTVTATVKTDDSSLAKLGTTISKLDRSTITVNVNANTTSLTKSLAEAGELFGTVLTQGVTSYVQAQKMGNTGKSQTTGFVYNGNTNPLIYDPKKYASGGTPTTGSLFWANENGPELIANIGHKTQVANNEQIIEGISAGVELANSEQNTLLREQNRILMQILGKDSTVIAQVSTDSIVNGLNRNNKRTGKTVVPIGT